jgi:hypothetical protein
MRDARLKLLKEKQELQKKMEERAKQDLREKRKKK